MAKKPGKYAGLIKTLPKAAVGSLEDPSFQAAVEAFKLTITDRSPINLARGYRKVKEKKAELEAQESGLNVELAAYAQLAQDAFEAADMREFTFMDGRVFEVKEDISVKTENKDAVITWLRENGLENQLSVNANTLASLTKKRLDDGLSQPAGVTVTAYKKVSLK